MDQPSFNFDFLEEFYNDSPPSGTQSALNDLDLQPSSSTSSSHSEVTESMMALLRDATSSPEDQNAEYNQLNDDAAASQEISDLLSYPADQPSVSNDNSPSPPSPATFSSPPAMYPPTFNQLPPQTLPQLPTSSQPQEFHQQPVFPPQAVYSPEAFNALARGFPAPQFQAPPHAFMQGYPNGYAPNAGVPLFAPYIRPRYHPQSQQPPASHHVDQNFPPSYPVQAHPNFPVPGPVFAQYPGPAMGQGMHVMHNHPQAQPIHHHHHFQNQFASSFPAQANTAGTSKHPRQPPLRPAPYYINQGHLRAAPAPADIATLNHDEQIMGSIGKWQPEQPPRQPKPKRAPRARRPPAPASATSSTSTSSSAPSSPLFVPYRIPNPASPRAPRPPRSARPNPHDPITCRLPAVHGPGLCDTPFPSAFALMKHATAARARGGHGMPTTKAKKTTGTTRACEWEGVCPHAGTVGMAVGNLVRHISSIHGGIKRNDKKEPGDPQYTSSGSSDGGRSAVQASGSSSE